MNGYDKLEPEKGLRSKLDLLATGTMSRSSVESISSQTLHLIAQPILRATSLIILIYLSSPHSPAPRIIPLLPVTLVVGKSIGRRLNVSRSGSGLGGEGQGLGKGESGGVGVGVSLGGKKWAGYAGMGLDVGACVGVCLVGRMNNVGCVLAGLSLIGLAPEIEFSLSSTTPVSNSRTSPPSILLAQIGLALTGIYISLHLAPTTSTPHTWISWSKVALGWVGIFLVDYIKRRGASGSGGVGVEGEGCWKGRGVRGPEIFGGLFALALGYTLLDGTTPTLPSFSAIVVCGLMIALFAVGSPIILNTPTRKDVYRELGVVGLGMSGLGGSGGEMAGFGLMLVGWAIVRHTETPQEIEDEPVQVQEEIDEGVVNSWGWRMMAVGGLAVLGLMTLLRRSPSLGMGFGGDMGMVRGSQWRAEVDYELAISLYDEPVPTVIDTINRVKRTLPRFSTSRTTIYTKKIVADDQAGLKMLLKEAGVDEVVALKNMGREGETYLQHISRRYASVDAPLAKQTFFLQPHLAWDWVAESRLKTLDRNTGFVSLGPYLNASCSADGNERDSHGMSFGRIPQIYSMFQGDLCPPTGFTITWAGQFVVSRRRILSTPLKTYLNLLGYFDVDKGSEEPKAWIWDEGWWNSQPTDPTHGHWLERSWPAVFKCSRLSLTHDCKDDGGPECECRDNVPGQGLL